ncbi:hypothetical protein GlitD10_0860 [Gloeomargarita lithophora Alchichica-D10]|uniref:Uncharacterized protein n=1 Tax=Gloeomargarita lithophora Alchichica-D10 TaxID=1188229 RepID=A0A1J0AB62_9CYAN|nr:hypothetical protein [Gloeomargarita lithophora]APB33176.1 hypothetical protein GlitD10_0860 [Gloeomargarita lithophora Alchichica-D10]
MVIVILLVMVLGLGLAWLAGQGLGVPLATVIAWATGAVVLGWMVLITTVPWNVYFRAREVLTEMGLSREQQLAVRPEREQYGRTVARRSLTLALGLHLGSAVIFLWLAQIAVVGYWGAGAALLLTGFRPTVRTYQFLIKRLGQIEQEVRYPREDVVSLREQVQGLEQKMQNLEHRLDENDPTSWISTQQRQWEALRQDVQRLGSQQTVAAAENQAEHQRLAQEAQQAIAQLSEDSRLLGQVRDLIRFFKEV